jgi:hypothetical protein
MSFEALKKNRSKSLEKLTSQLEKINTKGYSDPNKGKFWTPTRDSAGNGFAIIRFLPPPENEDMPFVQIWDHGFQGPTGIWYIENSLTTIGKPDPVAELNSKLWNASSDDESPERKQARKQKRRLKYIANIYVIKDSGKPENDGKVFLFAFGKKIWDKLNDLMNPSFEDEKPVNPFDFWDGANFRLKIRQFEGYANYDKSEFESPSPLFEDDSKLEQIYKQQHSLKELVDPKNFKTYEELQAKLHKVLGISGDAGGRARAVSTAEEEMDEDLDLSSLAKEKSAPSMKSVAEPSMQDDEEDEDLKFFKNLAKS